MRINLESWGMKQIEKIIIYLNYIITWRVKRNLIYGLGYIFAKSRD